MKILHSALMKHASSGILNQMTWEQEAAKQLNFVKSGLTKVEITVLDSLKK